MTGSDQSGIRWRTPSHVLGSAQGDRYGINQHRQAILKTLRGSDQMGDRSEFKALDRQFLMERAEEAEAALVAERALSDALVMAINEGCHVDVLGEEMVAAAFAEHRRLRGLPEED